MGPSARNGGWTSLTTACMPCQRCCAQSSSQSWLVCAVCVGTVDRCHTLHQRHPQAALLTKSTPMVEMYDSVYVSSLQACGRGQA